MSNHPDADHLDASDHLERQLNRDLEREPGRIVPRPHAKQLAGGMTLPTMYGFQSEPTSRAPRAWPRFMTARVAADYADSSPWTIRRHIRPCGRRARSFIYSIESVEEWMRGQMPARQQQEPASKPRRSNARRAGATRDLAKRDPHEVRVDDRNEHVAA